ncbi:Transcriptional regulator [Acinetobacter baumannii]
MRLWALALQIDRLVDVHPQPLGALHPKAERIGARQRGVVAQHDRFTISAADHGVDHITQCEFHLGVGMIGRAVLDDIIMQPARLTAEAASARFARQRDLQGAGLRRVAHAGIGAALVLHGQGGRARAGRGRAGEGAEQFLAVGFDVAEEFVAVGLALRQRHGRAGEGGIGLDRGAVPVQVIAVGDPPAHLDAVRRGGLRGQDEDLVDRRQFEVLGDGRGRGQRKQQGEPGQPAAQADRGCGHWLSLPVGSRRPAIAGIRAGRTRLRPRAGIGSINHLFAPHPKYLT